MYTGPKLVKDDLVFGYDTGHGIASGHRSTRFAPGQPTTNLYTNSSFTNGETGWSYGSWHQSAVTHTAVTVDGPYGEPITADKIYVGVSSTASHFHQGNGGKYVQGTTYTTSAWVKGFGVFKITSHWGGTESFTLTGNWQHVNMTVTAGANSGHFIYFMAEFLTVGSSFYITRCQTEAKPEPTPYVSSGSSQGVRANTASLIDLKKEKTITCYKTYDTASQPYYDGSNDYLVSDSILVEGSQSFETVFMPTENAHSPAGIISNHAYHTSPPHNFGINYIGGNKLGASIGYTDGTREYDSRQTTNAVWTNGNNVYVHAVLTYDLTANQLKWYINGEHDVTHSLTKTPSFAAQAMVSGRWTAAYNDYYFGGKIHLARVYKKELSAEEIKSNFEAIKNRFNI